MRTIAEYKNRYAGRRFVIVGKGPTRFQYENLGETDDPIIFINDAVQFDHAALPSIETFFFAHDPAQAIWLTSELKATAVLPLRDSVDSAGISMLSVAGLETRLQSPQVVTYNWDRWWHEHRNVAEELAGAVRDRSRIEHAGSLFVASGTVHSAIHFAWWCGASQITFIGCDGFFRDATQSYDPRIDCRSQGKPRGMFRRIRRDQDWLCDVLGLSAEYVNERHLAKMMPAQAHTIWFGDGVPRWVSHNVTQFREVNPDWEVTLWRQPPEDMAPDLLRLMADLPQFCTQKDVMSYWLLKHYGGVFFDADVVALRSFEPLRRYDTFIARDPSGRCNCAVMGAAPGASGAVRLLARVRELAATGAGPGGHRTTFGPKMLTEMFGRIEEARDDEAVDVLPLHYFYLFGDQKEAHCWWKGDDAIKQQAFDARRNAMTDGTPPYAIHLWGVEGSSKRAPPCPRADALLYRLRSMFNGRADLVGAEVGVFAGKMATNVLQTLPQARYYMVDNWELPPPHSSYWGNVDGSTTDIHNVRDHCMRHTCMAGDRRVFIECDSAEAAKQVPDNELDWVFIDADHRYEAVCKDLAAWWPKVRSGGLFAGHDFENPVGGGKWNVERAVREFLGERGLLDKLELGAEFTWFVVKP